MYQNLQQEPIPHVEFIRHNGNSDWSIVNLGLIKNCLPLRSPENRLPQEKQDMYQTKRSLFLKMKVH